MRNILNEPIQNAMIENKVTGKNVFTTNLRIFKSLLTRILFPQNSENVRTHFNRCIEITIKGGKW